MRVVQILWRKDMRTMLSYVGGIECESVKFNLYEKCDYFIALVNDVYEDP